MAPQGQRLFVHLGSATPTTQVTVHEGLLKTELIIIKIEANPESENVKGRLPSSLTSTIGHPHGRN